jgi:hypothetical protein
MADLAPSNWRHWRIRRKDFNRDQGTSDQQLWSSLMSKWLVTLVAFGASVAPAYAATAILVPLPVGILLMGLLLAVLGILGAWLVMIYLRVWLKERKMSPEQKRAAVIAYLKNRARQQKGPTWYEWGRLIDVVPDGLQLTFKYQEPFSLTGYSAQYVDGWVKRNCIHCHKRIPGDIKAAKWGAVYRYMYFHSNGIPLATFDITSSDLG